MRFVISFSICLIGLLLFDIWGLAAGIFVSSIYLSFSKSNKSSRRFSNFEDEQAWHDDTPEFTDQETVEISNVAFETFFEVAGCISKSDGHVSPQEIDRATQIMSQLSLSSEFRKIAIARFNEGKQVDFDIGPCLHRLRSSFSRNRIAALLLFESMLSISLADGINRMKEELLIEYAVALGLRPQDAVGYIAEAIRGNTYRQAYDGDRGQYSHEQPFRGEDTTLVNAYRTLGVDESDTDDTVKQSYRRLMQESHPDRLPKDLPEFLMSAASAKTREIQEAWETIKKARQLV